MHANHAKFISLFILLYFLQVLQFPYSCISSIIITWHADCWELCTTSLIPILWTQEFILHYLPSIRCNISQSIFIFGFHRTDTVVFQRIVPLCCCGNIQSSSIIMKGVCCCLSDNVPQFTYNRGKGTRQMLVVTKLPLRVQWLPQRVKHL